MAPLPDMRDWYEFCLVIPRRRDRHPWQQRRHLHDAVEREAYKAAQQAARQIPDRKGTVTVSTRAAATRDLLFKGPR